MFDVLNRAGVTPSIVARLLKVSRVTASLWINGHSKPHRLIERRVSRLLVAVKAAYDAKELPLSADVPIRDRSAETIRIIDDTLARLKLGSVSDE